eukprot:TRINITY_DN1057_c0_g1_i15.p1 TRINITY_DN1057_c0_g1~~TRINITY_DN1057_c0_g1_i15.p1  ORF type:complete len:623 (+),score=152.77 TRINITY_DN1057_c0_g1_i15:76-1944(+)
MEHLPLPPPRRVGCGVYALAFLYVAFFALCLVSVVGGWVPTAETTSAETRRDSMEECLCFQYGQRCPDADAACESWAIAVTEERVGLVVLVWLAFILVCLWRMCRFCCNTCGSRAPTPVCCGGGEGLFEGYHRYEAYGYRGLVFLAFIFAIILLPVGMEKDGNSNGGFSSVKAEFEGMTAALRVEVRDVVAAFEALPDAAAPSSMMTELRNMQASLNDAYEVLNDAVDVILAFNDFRSMITISVAVALLLGAAKTGVVGLCGAHCCIVPGLVIAGLFMLSFLGVLVAIISLILGTAFEDLCVTYASVTYSLMSPVRDELGCTWGSTTGFAQLKNQAADAVSYAAGEVCAHAVLICAYYDCSAHVTLEPCLAWHLDWARTRTSNDAVITEFLALRSAPPPACLNSTCCSVDCALPQLATRLDYLVPLVQDVQQLNATVEPLVHCESIGALTTALHRPICAVGDGLLGVYSCVFWALVLFVFASIVLTLAQKRWRYQAEPVTVICDMPPPSDVKDVAPVHPLQYEDTEVPALHMPTPGAEDKQAEIVPAPHVPTPGAEEKQAEIVPAPHVPTPGAEEKQAEIVPAPHVPTPGAEEKQAEIVPASYMPTPGADDKQAEVVDVGEV